MGCIAPQAYAVVAVRAGACSGAGYEVEPEHWKGARIVGGSVKPTTECIG